MPPAKSGRTLLLPFILVSSLFLVWGIANNMNDTLLAAFKRIMSMSDLQTSLVQFAFYGSYFCMAVPAALFIRKHSYKSGIILGLALYAAGTMLFSPAGQLASYPFFLVAIYVMAAGCAVLETTANPLILAMGAPQTATRRLNIAQMFNPLGAIIGIMLSRYFILSELHSADAAQRRALSESALREMQQHEFGAISATYMLIGCVLLVLMIVIACVKMPSGSSDDEHKSSTSELHALWLNKRYRGGVIAQFFYVGAQTCVWSFTIRLAMVQLNVLEASASSIFLYSILAFTAFRFIFTALMRYFAPVNLMLMATLAAIIATLMVIYSSGIVAVVALVAISGCMSLMFPTIYGIALDGIHGAEAKLAASGLIMAIVGGALITPLQGFVSDLTGNISLSFIVPLVCFIVILIYSITIHYADRK